MGSGGVRREPTQEGAGLASLSCVVAMMDDRSGLPGLIRRSGLGYSPSRRLLRSQALRARCTKVRSGSRRALLAGQVEPAVLLFAVAAEGLLDAGAARLLGAFGEPAAARAGGGGLVAVPAGGAEGIAAGGAGAVVAGGAWRRRGFGRLVAGGGFRVAGFVSGAACVLRGVGARGWRGGAATGAEKEGDCDQKSGARSAHREGDPSASPYLGGGR